MKGQATNGLILAGVIVIVAGVAWWRTAREDGPAAGNEATAAGNLTPVAATASVGEGGLDPEFSQTEKADKKPTGEPAKTRKLPRVVDLGADKCIPCKQMAPILVELRKEYEGRVTVDFIDVWKNPKAGDPYKIRMIPTQIFFDKEGKEVWRHEGFLPKADFIAKFKEMGVK